MSSIQVLRTEQKVPASMAEVWDFISSPNNLKDITPPEMGFTVTSEEDMSKMYAGMIITYKVKPVLNIPVTWVTEITAVKENEYFVDEQRFGPYSLWHHKHFIEPITGGVLMTDIIHYKLPFGVFGTIGIGFVKKKLNQIFNFRFKAVEEKFGEFKG